MVKRDQQAERAASEVDALSEGAGDRTAVSPAPVMLFEEPVLEEIDPDDRTPSDPEPAVAQARLASLLSLSLDRKAAPERTTSKLPWALLALVVVVGTYYHFHTVGSAEVAAEPENTEKAELPQLAEARPPPSASFLAAGYLAARDPITVGVVSSGRVSEVRVQNGQQVKRGQILARLDDGQVQAELALARAKERDVKRSLNRVRALAKVQAATPADLERATGQYEIATAERRVTAQRLEQTRIRAPIDGTVLEVLAHPGVVLTVAPDTVAGVLRIADLSNLVAEVDVNEADIAKVHVDQPAEVASDAQPDPKFSGRVREIAQQADKARGTVLVKVDLENVRDAKLKPGMAVKVRFLSGPSGESSKTPPQASRVK